MWKVKAFPAEVVKSSTFFYSFALVKKTNEVVAKGHFKQQNSTYNTFI